jgi:hypothetical protein
MDSLDLVETVMLIEDIFGTDVPEADVKASAATGNIGAMIHSGREREGQCCDFNQASAASALLNVCVVPNSPSASISNILIMPNSASRSAKIAQASNATWSRILPIAWTTE